MNTLSRAQIDELLALGDPFKIKDNVQLIGLKYWLDNNMRGTEECATGVGKTRIALMAIHKQLQKDKDSLIYIVVPTETLRDDDWPAEMEEAGYGYMAILPNVRRLCYASLRKEKPERDIDLMILDEIHHLTPSNVVFFNKTWKIFAIMGLTATLPDLLSEDPNDVDKRILIDRLAPPVFTIGLEMAVELQLVAEFEIYLMKFDLDHTDRYIDNGVNRAKTTEMEEYKKLTKVLAKSMWASKNENFKFQCMQKRVAFLVNLRTKTRLAKEIMEQILPNARNVIFCGSIAQSEELCGKQVYHSQTDDTQLKLFQKKKISYIGVVDAANEGKNFGDLNNILIVKFTSKERPIKQRVGRTIRFRPGHLGKIIILVAKKTVEEKWIAKALENFDSSRIKTFNVIPQSERTADV